MGRGGDRSDGPLLSLDSVIPTVAVQRSLAVMAPWVESMAPFILVGPEGCGKDMVIRHAFGQRRSTTVTTLNCNAQTTAQDVVSKVAQTCSLFSGPDGRVYRPRDSERLVLYVTTT
jgi:dynein heavy chain 2